MQLLDETVALARLRVARDPRNGRVRLRREYGFEFSREGDERRKGTVSILSGRVETVHLEHPEGPVVVPGPGGRSAGE